MSGDKSLTVPAVSLPHLKVSWVVWLAMCMVPLLRCDMRTGIDPWLGKLVDEATVEFKLGQNSDQQPTAHNILVWNHVARAFDRGVCCSSLAVSKGTQVDGDNRVAYHP